MTNTTPILQSALPVEMAETRPLPGIAPCAPQDWLRRDDAFAAQVTERKRLLRCRAGEVLAQLPEAQDACEELAALVAAEVGAGPSTFEDLAHLAQEDFCILQKHGDEHVLTAALLCFPASWRLAEKIGRPLAAIHAPVPEYAPVAGRVQRLFDGVQVGRPLWRFNRLFYHDPTLFQPRSEQAPRADDPGDAGYIRSERQCILRLPKTRAVVFSIHTYVVARLL